MLQNNISNIVHNFYCKFCDYGCSKKYVYKQHLNTAKHLNATNMLQNATNNIVKHLCECGKQFQHHSSYYRHKKKCVNNKLNENIFKNEEKEGEIKMLTELVKDVVKQNQDLTNKLVDICKNGTNNTITNNTNTNSHNKTFNLQFFLNETCKDAMNIMDFVDSLKLQLSDLENVGKIGYVEGISNIIVKNLNSLDENKRPVHCTDSKREVMYVKDEDKWEKENENKQKMRKMIKHVTHKNSKLLKEFKTKYPGCEKSESKFSNKYDKLIIEAMGGKGDNDLEKEDKIIKNIAKEVTIDKI